MQASGAEPQIDRSSAPALLVTESGRYLMQLRSSRSDILLPDHWSCFGGGIKQGERAEECLQRELREELGCGPRRAAPFTKLRALLPFPGQPLTYEFEYFVVEIEETEISGFDLREGRSMQLFWPADLAREKVAPWDFAAVLMHARREVLFPPPPDGAAG